MKNILRFSGLIILLLFVGIIQLGAQTVDIIDSSNYRINHELTNDLHPLAIDNMNGKEAYVATIRGSSENLYGLYYTMQNTATDLGANVYSILSFRHDTIANKWVSDWKLWYVNDTLRRKNLKLLNSNEVFVFGFDKHLSFKVNGKKYTLLPYHYFETTIKFGGKVKVNKGGLTGVTFVFGRHPDQENRYISTGGGSLAGASAGNGGIGVAITTGNLQLIDSPYGMFLSKALPAYK